MCKLSQLIIIFFISLFLISNVLFAGNSNPERLPNIVFILADDLGWADLPCYGNTFNEAPNIDKLAEAGMRFTNAYAACPVCSPTRASIQSGQYPARVGVIDFITGHWRPYEEVIVPKNRTQFLPPDIVTLAESVQKAGYKTGYFGKWHLGYEEEQLPGAQGYEEYHVYTGGGFYSPRFIPPLQSKNEKRLSEVLTDLGVDFIEQNQQNPFFLFLAHYDVHVQLDADKDLIEKYLQKDKTDTYPGNAVYASMIEHVDRSVGRVTQKLSELGLDDNTIVIFYSDNGGLIGRFDRIPLLAEGSLETYTNSPLKYVATSNAPLRAEKGTVYEGGIREPLIVKWPGKIESGVVSEAIVSSVDFYPTFLELAGIEKPEQKLDGVSLLSALLKNKFDPERAVFWHYPVYHHDEPAGAVRKGDWKLVQNFVSGKLSLYNLKANISESMDLSELYPEKTQELKSLLENWQETVHAEFPVPNPNFDKEKRFEWGIHPDRQ
ncbi:sulfatase [Maribellus maritimus]|uniref:sulfatase n=1 Tax=Maribellus maritimus TaxID=2870838 RepID=UPI001EECDA4B|nr:sulfatase [Maribellus maritimus]MCG6189553.1 sulfatase [Maribellus maritimus]